MGDSKLIRSHEDLSLVADQCDHIVTLFSGGLDSSYLLKSLVQHRCKVTALAIDLGGGVDREMLSSIASRFGAALHIIDGREAFANDAVRPAICANARYMGIYPISASLSRPFMARFALETAAKLGADAIVHTANQSQNSLRRLNGAIRQLGFKGFFGTPYEYSAITREQKQSELETSGLEPFRTGNVSGDANLWCREFESGSLDNPERFVVPEQLFHWTVDRDVTTRSNQLSVTFFKGVPVALDDVQLDLVALIDSLNYRAGAFTIGRYCGLEHLEAGEKVLEVREAPAASILLESYRHIETATLEAEVLREKVSIEQLWVREAVEGRWFGDLRTACEAFIGSTALHVNGRVEFTLRAGAADVCSIKADRPRYLTDRDDWERRTAVSRASRHLVIDDREAIPNLGPVIN